MKGSDNLTYPRWVESRVDFSRRRRTADERMELVVELAQFQAIHHTGGPFTAAVFEGHEGRLVSVGMSLVQETLNPFNHAPIVALRKACQAEGLFDLGDKDGPEFELLVIAAPCGFCVRGILLSGIRRVVYGASENAVEQELPEMERLDADLQPLRAAGVVIQGNILAAEARQKLRDYHRGCGPIYNPRRSS